jgi:hypothetical protein
MDPIPITILCIMLIGGLAVLFTYALLYAKYTGRFGFTEYSEDEKRILWAIFHAGLYFWFWTASVGLCVIAFLFFSLWVICNQYTIISNPPGDSSWFVYPYASFLVFSSVYGPLLMFAMKKEIHPMAVIITTLFVALSVLVLWVWTILYLDFSSIGNLMACILMGWLTVHCLALDFGWWGYSWYKLVSENHDLISGPSVSSQWPAIQYQSLSKAPRNLRLPEQTSS